MNKGKVLVKKCHMCGHIIEGHIEAQRCPSCRKSFLPMDYFSKIHNKDAKAHYDDLFSSVEEIFEEDLIKGLNCLW